MDTEHLVRLGAKRLLSAVKEEIYLNLQYDITKPETIRGMVNQRCNYKCQYCYCWQRAEYPEISIEQWKAALLSLKDYIGKFVIQFSGGEPFIKKGFTSLLTFCHQHDIDWGVITNGSVLTKNTVDIIVAATPLNIDISIDSPIARDNDFVRGAKNSLPTIAQGLARLTNSRLNAHASFLIRIKPTVTRQNFRALPNLVVWTKKHGANSIDFSPVRPEPFWTQDNYTNLWLEPSDLEELEQVVEQLVKMKADGFPIETSFEKLKSFCDHFMFKDISHGAIPCRVGLRNFNINADGNVEVCWEYPPIGNVTRQSAREIWESPEANLLRSQTVTCEKFKSINCANSCLTHRTLKQEFKRALHFMKVT